ncbi:MAG: hypothetical protein AXA67_07955 [Methylothermaceae bacteria B42]|nr:MAG: hypothetical protein AXA67_07955 [Methylothermaceae bacteria B42]HHJ40426.1 DUF1501 domain-containing protein [Methylothermaceae bacterium]
MHRRKFLKNMLALPVIGGGLMFRNPLTLAMNSARAEAGQGPILVVIFMRGGNDGLNTIVPHGEDRYYDVRPNIAIDRPGSGPAAALDLDGFFGLHPALRPLQAFYQSNELAIMPTVHYPNAIRSHFQVQPLLEGGAVTMQRSGWLNRYLAAKPKPVSLRAASIGDKMAFALDGNVTVPVVNASQSGFWGAADYKARLPQILRETYSQSPNGNLYRSMNEAVHKGMESFELLRGLDPDRYMPENGVNYPDTNFGQAMRRLAQIIKAGMGLEAATVDIGGWDTHAKQGGVEGNHAEKLAEYASGVAAFYNDLAAYRQNLLVLTMTDFGRTVRENGSLGTDHGNAATWMALGGNVRGGIHGDWPGLEDDQLYLGRYLAHTIDFRDVLGEVLSRHLSFPDPARILAGHNYQPIGFLG